MSDEKKPQVQPTPATEPAPKKPHWWKRLGKEMKKVGEEAGEGLGEAIGEAMDQR